MRLAAKLDSPNRTSPTKARCGPVGPDELRRTLKERNVVQRRRLEEQFTVLSSLIGPENLRVPVLTESPAMSGNA